MIVGAVKMNNSLGCGFMVQLTNFPGYGTFFMIIMAKMPGRIFYSSGLFYGNFPVRRDVGLPDSRWIKEELPVNRQNG